MAPLVSVIIPNYNGGSTIGKCLSSVFSSNYPAYEVIVVDDCSEDDSVDIIKGFPCRLIRLESRSGAAKARNTGVADSSGEILFFTDSDCVLEVDTLPTAVECLLAGGDRIVVGGTYSKLPYDKGFFSTFQSVFINYSETKYPENPDYLATHAMAIYTAKFKDMVGFREDLLPILEDVEFSHRAKRAGYSLLINPDLVVRHIFNYSLYGSIRNAFLKSMYWTVYSFGNGDVLSDSGTASIGLKISVVSLFLIILFTLLYLYLKHPVLPLTAFSVMLINLIINRRLITAFYRAKGSLFAIFSSLYYMLPYSLTVGIGAIAGTLRYLKGKPAGKKAL